jgi:predicted ABC-type ATPase
MNSKNLKTLTVIAGPNGAGKTTFAKRIYPDSIANGSFLNADIFAEEIDSENVSKVAVTAGKQFLNQLEDRLNKDHPIIIETTLSGRSLLRRIEQAKRKGFLVRLIFLVMTSAAFCDFRVKTRVSLGGHNIPFDDIKRRYHRGLQSLAAYLEVVDEYEIFLANEMPILVVCKNVGAPMQVVHQDLYRELQEVAGI